MSDLAHQDAITVHVMGLPPCKQIQSLLSPSHPHRPRVVALLAATSSSLPKGFAPFRGAVSLEVTLRSPLHAPPGDVTNFLGGIADVLQRKPRADELGELAHVAVYENDRQIRRIAFQQLPDEDLRYELHISGMAGPPISTALRTPILGLSIDVPLVDTDELAIEFVNLMLNPQSRGISLADESALVLWLALQGVAQQPLADQLHRNPGNSRRDSESAFEEAERLASALSRIFTDSATADDLVLFNDLWRRCLVDVTLNTDAESDSEVVSFMARELRSLLAPVLSSAIRLMRPSIRHRLRLCGNVACGRLFLDKSKTGTRLWCSMALCGNRAKARAWRLRHARLQDPAVGYVVAERGAAWQT